MATDWHGAVEAPSYAPERFTTAVYQTHVAGKPRLSGARAALEYFGVPDVERRAVEYAERKQRRIHQLIKAGEFVAFPDALRCALALKALGVLLAAASSSKNANRFMERIRLDLFAQQERLAEPHVAPGRSLLDLFDANVCGRDLPRGKPDPQIFQVAADELGVAPAGCIVVEDAPAGVQAAKAAGMGAIGVARLHDDALLVAAGADLVVATLDDVVLGALREGRLERASQPPPSHAGR
jgi:beta-phosphoglucomutase-like phosphatase (HAD superfamily)